MASVISAPVFADPPPPLPDPFELPTVFCLRVTDIERVVGDPESNRFRFTFEALNWTSRQVAGIKMSLNTATSDGVVLYGGGVDHNGRGGATDTNFDDIPDMLVTVEGDGFDNPGVGGGPAGNGPGALPDSTTTTPSFMGTAGGSTVFTEYGPLPIDDSGGFGNRDNPNLWNVSMPSSTSVLWSSPFDDIEIGGQGQQPATVDGDGPSGADFFYSCFDCTATHAVQPLPNIDLVNAASYGSVPAFVTDVDAAMQAFLNDGTPLPPHVLDAAGDTILDGGEDPDDVPPITTPGTYLGNAGGFRQPGTNAADGFTIEVDGLDEGDVLSLNWQFLQQTAFPDDDSYGGLDSQNALDPNCATSPEACLGNINNPFRSPVGGVIDPFSFGTLSLQIIDEDAPPSGPPLFAGNSGMTQAPFLFFGDVANIPNPAGVVGELAGNQVGTPQNQDDILALILGTGVTPQDPLSTVTEPETLALLGLGALALGFRRRFRYRTIKQS